MLQSNADAGGATFYNPNSQQAPPAAGGGGGSSYVSPGFDPNSQAVVPPQDTNFYKGVHPVAALFHVLFKIGAILTFILGGLFSSSYVIVFIITILCIAADFWVTKNISGRLLVCLRWWNEVSEDGTSKWIFESASDAEQRVNAFDSYFFWITTGGNVGVWLLLAIFNLMAFSRLPMALAGLILGGTNLLGYFKCSRDAKKHISNFVIAQATQRPDMVRQVVTTAAGTK